MMAMSRLQKQLLIVTLGIVALGALLRGASEPISNKPALALHTAARLSQRPSVRSNIGKQAAAFPSRRFMAAVADTTRAWHSPRPWRIRAFA